ncbi:MAG: KOW domain-containing RNA-binding protein [Clostridia bacterium]|nr:KOW domain-containing RNA-binding protein [Clostridia bacterium]
MDERFVTGYFAKSKAGHDAGSIYVILDSDERFVYLSEGRLKTVDNPKRKKRKHLQLINERAEEVMAKLDKGLPITNEDVKRSIKLYNSRK